VVVSTDDHVERYAQSVGKTYSDVFAQYMPTAIQLMADDVVRARDAGRDIIWDQTSTTVNTRRKKFNMLPNYRHIAVVFETPPLDVLKKRLASRPGKVIPDDVVSMMIRNFTPPTVEEGYTEVINVRTHNG
jgi:predicted kinase